MTNGMGSHSDPYPSCTLLYDFVAARARSSPALVALSWRGDDAEDTLDISYRDLITLALTLAKELTDLEQLIIPICLPKSIEMVVSMLAVSSAGKAYCNIEPDLPTDRKRDIVEESTSVRRSVSGRPTVVGSVEGDFNLVDPSAVLVRAIERLGRDVAIEAPISLQDLPRPDPSSPAYLIYTSGSTGKPKGIIVSHSNVAAFLRNYHGIFSRCPADDPRGCRVLQFASYGFDVIVMNVWDTFAHGGTLCVTTRNALRSDLAQAVRDLRCTHVDLTPSVSQLLLDAYPDPPADSKDLPAWREKTGCALWHLSTGSEPVPRWLTEEWLQRGVTVVNDYGPSETTVGVSSSRFAPGDSLEDLGSSYLHIGRPNGSSRIYLFDSSESAPTIEVERGEVGEICVGGPQVSNGYVRTELNDGIFVDHAQYGRLYRTGDLGKWREVRGGEPVLECLGRKDTQVKINGLRIEVGEIEQHLTSSAHSAIISAVVDKIEPASGAPALVAFLSLSASFARLEGEPAVANSLLEDDSFRQLTTGLSERLARVLPVYMVPRFWLPVTAMPIQQSGKTDRKRLRELASKHDFLSSSFPSSAPSDAEDDASEEYTAMREVWAQVLRLKPAELRGTDGFAQRGGDSIGFIRLVGLLRKREFAQASFASLSQAGTLREAARSLRTSSKHGETTIYQPFALVEADRSRLCDSIVRETEAGFTAEDIEDVWPATPAQDALVAPSLDGSGSYYAQAVYPLSINSRVDPERLAKAIQQLVLLHPMLRSAFAVVPKVEGMVQIVFRPREGGYGCGYCHVVQVDGDIDEAIEVWRKEDMAGNAFAWGRVHVAFRLFVPSDGVAKLVWSMHHALSDGWTLDLLQDDLKALCDGRSVEARPLFAQVSRFWRQPAGLQDDVRRYWTRYLDNASSPSWPSFPPAYTPSTRHAAARRWNGDLSSLSRSHGITPAIASRVAIYLAILRCSALIDLVVGIVRSGRDIAVPDADAIVGPCVSVLPARAGIVRASTFLEAMQAEAQTDLDARQHQRISLSSLQSCAPRIEAGERLFSTLITYQSLAERGEEVLPIAEPPESIIMPTVYALSIELTPLGAGRGMDLHAYYDEKALSSDEVEELLERLVEALDLLVADPQARVETFLPTARAEVKVPMRNGSTFAEEGEAPKELVDRVRQCWAQVLRSDRLDATISFAHLGGDSISAMRLSALLKRQGLAIASSKLAVLPTINSQAAWLARKE